MTHENNLIRFRNLHIITFDVIFQQVPIYASYLYDAVYLYCRALLECLQKGIDPRNGTAILSRIKNRMYESMQHKKHCETRGGRSFELISQCFEVGGVSSLFRSVLRWAEFRARFTLF